MQKTFSIIVPIYKVEKYLSKCIDSVLKQQFRDFELILVDDGSPDNCPKICDDYLKKDKRIKVIHKKNGGLVSARNIGLENAIGKYILYLDGDDWITDNGLKNIYDKVIKDYNPDIIITNMTKVFENKSIDIPSFVEEKYYTKEELQQYIYPYMMYDKRKKFYHGLVFPSAGGKIIKTTLLKQHFCQDKRIKMGEDNAYLFECIYYADTVYFSNEYFYMYNQLSEVSMVHNYDSNRLDNNKILIEYIEKSLKGLDKNLDYQINAFKAYWLIMAVFHEEKCNRKYNDIKKHLKNKLSYIKPIDDINLDLLPKVAKYYLLMLKHNMYFILLPMTKIMVKIRNRRD